MGEVIGLLEFDADARSVVEIRLAPNEAGPCLGVDFRQHLKLRFSMLQR